MTEIVAARTCHAKVFDLGGGQRRVRTSLMPQHVPPDPATWTRRAPTAWRDLDLTFAPTTDRIELRLGWCGLTLPLDAVGYTYTSKVGVGQFTVALEALDGVPVTAVPTPRLDAAEVWWDDVRPGLSVFVRAVPGRVEIYKRLTGPQAPRVFTWRVTESDPLAVTVNHATLGRDNADLAEPAREGTGVGRKRRQLQMLHAIGPIDTSTRGQRSYTVTETWTGKTIALDAARVPSLSDDVVYPVLIDQDITETIGADNDDGAQTGTTTWVLSYGGTGDTLMDSGSGVKRPGFRFQTVAVPNAATIDAATLTINVVSISGGPGGNLFGNATDDAPAWANNAGPANMTPTTALFDATLPASGDYAMDVATIVQEIVDRAGWASGNDMAFGFQGTLDSGYGYINDLAGGASNIAVLTIDYTASGAAPAKPLRQMYTLGMGA